MTTQKALSRRRMVAGVVAAACLGLVATQAAPAGAAGAAGAATEARSGDGDTFLVVSDPESSALQVFRSTDLHKTGSLKGIDVDTHVGVLGLPDGRLILVDEEGTVHAVRLGLDGRPRMERSVAIPTHGQKWNGAAWAAIDPTLRYYGVTSAFEDSAEQTVTILDVRTFRTHQLPVTVDKVNGRYTEVQVSFGGRPTQIVTAAGGRFQTFNLADVLADRVPIASSDAPLGAGNHGPVVTRSGDRHFSTTMDGIDGATLKGNQLTPSASVKYSQTRNVVQVWRPRLAPDNRTIWGSASEDTGLKPEQWVDTRNDVFTLDTTTSRPSLTRIPDGLPGRLALSNRYAAVTTLSPEGDVTTLLNANPDSDNYRRVVGTIALPRLSKGPVPGQPADGTEDRATAITPDGTRVFVTSGGDARITVIDTRKRRIVATITTATPLYGAHLTVLRLGAPITDLIAR